MSNETSEGESPLFQQKNDTMRIERVDQFDAQSRVPIMAFLRHIGSPHLYWERILPAVEDGDAQITIAVRDRPWPPWGLGAQKIHALCLVQDLNSDSVSLSPVLVGPEDRTNIGLSAAVYKEVLEDLIAQQKTEVNYLVIDGSILAHRVLTAHSFKKSDDIFLTENARYNVYRANVQELLDHLGLAQASTPDLLLHDIEDATLDKNALFHATLQLASSSETQDRFFRPEIISFVGIGRLLVSQPGGAPPPGSPGPSIFPGEEGGPVI